MATVMVIIPGAAPMLVSASSIKDLKEQLGLSSNYQAMIEGEPANDETTLTEHARVTLAEKQKGA